MMNRLRQAFQTRLPMVLLFDAPTIRQMAVAIEFAVIEEVEHMDETEAQQLAQSGSAVAAGRSGPDAREVPA
jgi:hypothetical protein